MRTHEGHAEGQDQAPFPSPSEDPDAAQGKSAIFFMVVLEVVGLIGGACGAIDGVAWDLRRPLSGDDLLVSAALGAILGWFAGLIVGLFTMMSSRTIRGRVIGALIAYLTASLLAGVSLFLMKMR